VSSLTNAFFKKAENHEAVVCGPFPPLKLRPDSPTLSVTPAMAAGDTDHVWEIDDVIDLLDAAEAERIGAGSLKRGKYRKKEYEMGFEYQAIFFRMNIVGVP
jgi:hypothetical protein